MPILLAQQEKMKELESKLHDANSLGVSSSLFKTIAHWFVYKVV
jgi:hypothetical protein